MAEPVFKERHGRVCKVLGLETETETVVEPMEWRTWKKL
jgi:hypothetical protein